MMPKTRVVNLHDSSVIRYHPDFVYIGRGVAGFRRSKWANPYFVGRGGDTREEAIAKYRKRILGKPELLAALPELRGKILACWCKPEACHGDVLVELLDALGDKGKEGP